MVKEHILYYPKLCVRSDLQDEEVEVGMSISYRIPEPNRYRTETVPIPIYGTVPVLRNKEEKNLVPLANSVRYRYQIGKFQKKKRGNPDFLVPVGMSTVPVPYRISGTEFFPSIN